jgi:hypothetical protein
MTDPLNELQPKEPSTQPVEQVIRAFGGAQALARRLNLPVATVEDWRAKRAIPRAQLPAIAKAAEAAKVALDAATLAESARAAPTIEGQLVETPPPEPARAPPSWLRRLAPQVPAAALGGVLVVAGFLLAMGTSDLWLGPPEDLKQRVAALEERPAAPLAEIDGLSAAVAALQKEAAELRTAVQARPSGADSGALEQLRAEVLAELDRRIAALPGPDAAGVQSLKDEIAALTARLAAVEQQQQELAAEPAPSTAGAAAAALALAVVDLGNALRAGMPYGGELAVVQQLAAGDAVLATPLGVLALQAESGIATLETLRQELAALAPAIVEAGGGGAGDGVVGDLLSGLSGLVSVRPTGEVEGETPAARVARAELRLEEGDLAAALAELQALEGEAAAAAQPWIARAEAHQAMLAALDQLSQQTLGRLAGN